MQMLGQKKKTQRCLDVAEEDRKKTLSMKMTEDEDDQRRKVELG